MVEATIPHINGNGVNGGSSSSAVKSKNAKRRAKKKDQRDTSATPGPSESESEPAQQLDRPKKIARPAAFDLTSSLEDSDAFAAFSDVFARFQARAEEQAAGASGADADTKGEVIYSDDDQMSESDDEESKNKVLSKRKQRQLRRLTVAELKQIVKKPEMVDWEDVTSTDPRLLIHLKSSRNTIPVPPHWSLKRDYLQNKKGIEKPPFQLPSYIAATGIAEMKDALKEKEVDQTLKAKTRERVQPKMGKVNIDYQKLHDAFFRFQTKPDNLTGFGEVYYEGKEFETKFKERKPGDLSDELKEALSIPPLAPPPWLIAMQRFGPPPNYPQLRIPGLNAPIPDGAQWGFHPGGWGRPPMDELGNPLFGDVMGPPEGQEIKAPEEEAFGEPIQKERWGELEPEEDESDEEDDTEDEDAGEEADRDEDDLRSGMETPMDGLQTPSGFETPGGMQSVASTVPGGLETPDFLELRKGARGREEYNGPPKQLYQVIPERQTAGGKGFLTSDHGYDLAQLNPAAPPGTRVLDADDRSTKRKGRSTGVEVALDASELEGLTEAQLAARYEQAQAAARGSAGGEDTNSEDLALLREELQRKRSHRDAKRAAR